MNGLLHTNSLPPHLLNSRLSPSRDAYNQHHAAANMSSRKRKASEEPVDHDMSPSPSASPHNSSRPRITKRTRTGAANGRPLALPRLLETLSADQMRQLLQNVCDQHPDLQHEIVTRAPRPSIESTLSVLSRYENAFRESFPLGNRTTSDYAYNRVRHHLLQLIEAVREYTPHFLPPHETQDAQSLTYLDSVTNMIHRLPDWDTYLHQRHKDEAYDEIAKAWALVIREAAKRAGGFHLQFGGWDHKLVEHNQKSRGRMEEAVNELKAATGFLAQNTASPGTQGASDERASIRQQLFSGTYGQQLGVGKGW
ncbi:related to Tethering factor for nuclear proteasome STS1 [Ramularia collo-cygni]|uniref:Tethering factor for nuclear proteasome STS1 n=1 Tax=Ramularia collo-cygni TaxID=112498 RepID=A0A2D3USK5_9PEZI|nr:related to Tethering factor for nuclear proteasome STS1 [Ramularia collo-cygni]CZT20332.1 related to Tethering factor for nuclear proteasome STS1 [Ramularia collo-cygni]